MHEIHQCFKMFQVSKNSYFVVTGLTMSHNFNGSPYCALHSVAETYKVHYVQTCWAATDLD